MKIALLPVAIMMATIVTGDLFAAPCQAIAHQCNCVTTRSKHLAADVFKHYPYANVYSNRYSPDRPGTVKVCTPSTTGPIVFSLFAQYYPGGHNTTNDSPSMREAWFAQCLSHTRDYILRHQSAVTTIAFPWCIGCGSAGGDWSKYHAMIDKFAKEVLPCQVYIYRLP